MIIIGVTGSIASGKSTVAKFIAKKKYPLFNADKIVLDLYKDKKFVTLIFKKFNLNNKNKIKKQIRSIVKKNKGKLKILESIIHPLVREKMYNFLKMKSKILVLEVIFIDKYGKKQQSTKSNRYLCKRWHQKIRVCHFVPYLHLLVN